MAYQMTLRYGDDANDLPENDTSTSLLTPWIEFADDLILVQTQTVKMLGKTKILGAVKILCWMGMLCCMS